VLAAGKLRDTFVSVMSESRPRSRRSPGGPAFQPWTTETIYRQELRPVITTGVHVMDKIVI